MTIQSDDRKTSEVLTDGVTAIYDYDFPVFYGEDGGKGIEVRYVNNLGFDVVPQSSYLVLPNTENSGGSIQFQQAPISGKRLQIVGKTQVDQQLDITNHGRFQAEAIETNFDKIFAIMQEWYRSLDEEARQRISNDAQIVNQYVLDHQNIREYLEGRLNAKWVEINTFFDNLLPVFFCVMRKEIDSFVYSDSSIAEIIKRIGSLIDTNWTADFIVVAGGGTQQDVNDRIGNTWRNKVGGYGLNDRVMLENGDIVKSTVANNIINPNVDMTGWLIQRTKTVVETMADLRLLKNTKEGELVFVKGYYTGNFALTNPHEGGGDFVWVGGSTVTPVQGIIEQVTGVTTGRYLRVIESGEINVLWCGARRNGTTETHVELKIALQYSINNNMSCYAPKGIYLLGNRVDPTLNDKCNVVFYGDDYGQTIFKERDGLTAQIGRYNMNFYFLATAGKVVNNMVFKDFTIDKNGHTSMLTPEVIAADGLYAHEQAHCLGISGQSTTGIIKNVLIENVRTLDKVGAGVCFMAGQINKVIVNNLGGEDWQHNGGQRGDFEFQSTIGNLVVNDSYGLYAQCEPDVATPAGGLKPVATFNNCNYAATEFTAYRSSPTAQTLVLNNHIATTKLTLRDLKAIINDSNYAMGSDQDGYWSSLAKGSISTNSNVIVKTDIVNNRTSPIYIRSSIGNVPTYMKFLGGTINPDGNFNPETTTGFAIQNTTYTTNEQVLELEDVAFNPSFERSVDCYANGSTTIKNCKLAARGALPAVRIGGFSTYKADVILDGNDLSQLSGNYIEFLASNVIWSLNMKGVHDFSKCGFTSNNIGNTEICSKSDGYFVSAITPTVKGILGWRVKINKPIFGYPSEYICTTTHSATSVYQLAGQAGVKLDTTANRPTGLTAASRGLRYLDTTLAAGGKPIQYNGTGWTDSLGAVV